MTLGSRIKSVISDARDRAGSGAEATTRGAGRGRSHTSPETSLFECQACHTVYVAVEKSTCSSCESPVREVAATLSTE